MSRRGAGTPPRRWLRLLDVLLPSDEGERLRHELLELYRDRVDEHGRGAADAWLRRQVLAFLPLFLGRAVRTPFAVARYAAAGLGGSVRALFRAPAFAMVAALTLGVGIGAASLVGTIVDGVLLRPLPFPDAERLVDLWTWVSRGEVSMIRRGARTLSDVRMYQDNGLGVNLESGGSAQRLETSLLEPGLLELLGARPLLGRTFAPEEAEPGRGEVVILSEGLWRTTFGADSSVLGREVIVDGRPHRVVGVLPASWTFPSPHDRLWLPMPWDPTQAGPFWGFGGFSAVARLAPSATVTEADRELRALAPEIARSNPLWSPDPTTYRADGRVVELRASLVGDVRPTLVLLLFAVALVVLAVAANVSSLLAARALERRGALAVRTALGAGRTRLAGEALAESVALGVAGTALGVVLAASSLELLRPTLLAYVPRSADLALDGRALGLTWMIGLAISLVSGTPVAFRAGRRAPAAALTEVGRAGSMGRSARRSARLLVAGQVAAAVVLVASAGLLARTMHAIGRVEPGFRTEGVTTAEVTFPSSLPESAAEGAYAAILERVRALGGVRGAALAGSIPFGVNNEAYATAIEGVTSDPNALPMLDVDRVSPSYFDVLGIPVLEGRVFTEADREGAPLVAVIDETMAREYWPGERALGKRVRYPWVGAPWIEVVGVVGSVADDRLTEARAPRWYVPLAQRPAPNVTLVVASDEGWEGLGVGLREAVREVDARLPVSRVLPYGSLLGEAAARERLTTWLVSLFAGSALFLGCLGVYGVAACSVRERTREIGVRLALGAERSSVSADVLREGLWVVTPGALLGLVGAGAATRFLEGLLYGVQPLDPVTFVGVTILTAAAALAALWLPAARAARLDPLEALRA